MNPIKMLYISGTQYKTEVDVYQFFLKPDGSSSALCWLLGSRTWLIIDIENLIPIHAKQLNE